MNEQEGYGKQSKDIKPVVKVPEREKTVRQKEMFE